MDAEEAADDMALHPAAAAAERPWSGGGAALGVAPAASPLPDISHDTLSQLELLLESVHHSAAGTTIAATEMSRSLAVKRDILQLQQREYQNRVLSVSLRTSQASMALASATWLTSLFGMNLPSTLETVGGAFVGVSVLSGVAGVGLYAAVTRLTSFHEGVSGGLGASPRRLETLQAFLLQLDSRLDAARETLAAAAATLAQRSGGEAGGDGDGGFGRGGTAAAAAAAAFATASMTRAEFTALHAQMSPGAPAGEGTLLFDLLTNRGTELRLSDVLSLSSRIEGFHTVTPPSPHGAAPGSSGGALFRR
jgi:hypothetical protein